MKHKITISIISGILLGLLVSYLMYGKRPEDTSLSATSETGPTATTTQKKKKIMTVGGVTFETDADNPGGITLEEVPITAVPKPLPELSNKVTFSSSIGTDAQKIIQGQVANLSKKLTANPGILNDWLTLGLYRKMAGEYAIARDMWEYAKKLQPGDMQAYNNLGDLYQYYLKDFAKAELNWKKTIELDVKFITGYRSLYDLYVQNKQLSKAKAVLESGLAKNPRSIDILVLLGQYYRDLGESAVALTYYTKALAEARTAKENASLVPVIQVEIDALK